VTAPVFPTSGPRGRRRPNGTVKKRGPCFKIFFFPFFFFSFYFFFLFFWGGEGARGPNLPAVTLHPSSNPLER